MSVEEYVYARTKTGRVLDPELALYLSLGMKIEKIIPNYFDDPESLNYGVLVSWANPFYPFTKYSKLLAKIASALFRL
jgi:ribosomal protein S18 acetylase RimI-like enzyme